MNKKKIVVVPRQAEAALELHSASAPLLACLTTDDVDCYDSDGDTYYFYYSM